MEFRVGYNYRLGRIVGGGAFGEIYLGTDITTGSGVLNTWVVGNEVAIKLESSSSRNHNYNMSSKYTRRFVEELEFPVRSILVEREIITSW